jgi:hypothetical protein
VVIAVDPFGNDHVSEKNVVPPPGADATHGQARWLQVVAQVSRADGRGSFSHFTGPGGRNAELSAVIPTELPVVVGKAVGGQPLRPALGPSIVREGEHGIQLVEQGRHDEDIETVLPGSGNRFLGLALLDGGRQGVQFLDGSVKVHPHQIGPCLGAKAALRAPLSESPKDLALPRPAKLTHGVTAGQVTEHGVQVVRPVRGPSPNEGRQD